jgi:hypothetical protein
MTNCVAIDPTPSHQRFDEVLHRARAEFLEMPGLKLTARQAARLLSVDATLCEQVLSALVESRFLTETPKSGFVRNRH